MWKVLTWTLKFWHIRPFSKHSSSLFSFCAYLWTAIVKESSRICQVENLSEKRTKNKISQIWHCFQKALNVFEIVCERGCCVLTVRASDWEWGDWHSIPAIWAKSLTPRFALMNHFRQMMISVKIDPFRSEGGSLEIFIRDLFKNAWRLCHLILLPHHWS